MKVAELRDKEIKSLHDLLGESREELFKLRFQHATAQLEKTHKLGEVKKNIARILTVLREKSAPGA